MLIGEIFYLFFFFNQAGVKQLRFVCRFFVCVTFAERAEWDGFVWTAKLDVAFVLWCEAE